MTIDEQQKYLEEYLKYIKGLTPEQYVKEFLHLNGTMTEELFNKVIQEVIDKGNIDAGTDLLDYPQGLGGLGYYKESIYKINPDEFFDVIHYLEQFFKEENYVLISGMFYNAKVFFIYQENHYVFETIVGQGTVYYLYVDNEEEWKKYFNKVVEIKIDPTIKFYKILEKE